MRVSTETAITGTGVWHPDHVLTNEELCVAFNAFVERDNRTHAAEIAAGTRQPLRTSSPEFIERGSGIKRRYIVDKTGVLDPERMCPSVPDRPDDQLSLQAEFGVNAIQRALTAANRTGEDVDLVVCGTSMMQRSYPAMGIEIQNAIGAHGFALDVTLGCASAVAAIQIAVNTIRAGMATCAIAVAPEMMSGHNNWRERDGHFLFGDAAVAVVIEPVSRGRGWEILSTRMQSKFSSNIRNNFGFLNRFDPQTQYGNDKLFYQAGRRVYKDVVPAAQKFIGDHLAAHGLAADRISRFWLHQANQNMNELIAERLLGRPATRVEAPIIIDEYGNTASAGAPIAFSLHSADLAAGSYGLLAAFGAGYSFGSLLLQRI
jgi:beta-ketodecanoyl-[acyl-carrier-protein] synthase